MVGWLGWGRGIFESRMGNSTLLPHFKSPRTLILRFNTYHKEIDIERLPPEITMLDVAGFRYDHVST